MADVTVMEYISGGELFDAWKQSVHFDETQVKIYIAELALVLGKQKQIYIVCINDRQRNLLDN